MLDKNVAQEILEHKVPTLRSLKQALIVKYNADGTVERFRARLVAQGNHQEFGVDCDEVYAPVARFESLRLVLAIGTILNCHIHQMDVHTAFLNDTMEGEQKIYMRQPHGFMKRDHEHLVCELQKSIYGLKQAFASGIESFIPS
ncbi:Integrase catalytic core protein [Phytophthora palmivora]|uniref:Integrase catalytic core protein n=1 Tax=Phytophthora palmivora TaxID=4796 RepID=A0A2P4XEZ5_9STRA|nr:Integrase catalytic core protein [Phytophthora palmivora]